MTLTEFAHTAHASAIVLRETLEEVVWPTRCVLCDTPGVLVCPSCALRLPYLDQLQACGICGAAFGELECCECNTFTLEHKGLTRFPLDGCASACMFSDATRRIVTVFKDRGELRLAHFIAYLMAACIPPAWFEGMPTPALVPIPARKTALRQRGYDHIELITKELQGQLRLPVREILRAEKRRDQRALNAQERLENMRGSFSLRTDAVPKKVILIDDVFTTGATLFAAADTLRDAGCETVYALTFIRA